MPSSMRPSWYWIPWVQTRIPSPMAFLALEHSVGEWSVAMVKMRSKEAK